MGIKPSGRSVCGAALSGHWAQPVWTWFFLSHRFSEEGRVHKVAGGSQVREREIEMVREAEQPETRVDPCLCVTCDQ